ncbi:MAG: thiamine pyrophosphate-binding protein [Polyangiales bacterium]
MANNTSAKAILPPSVAGLANLPDLDSRPALAALSEAPHNPPKVLARPLNTSRALVASLEALGVRHAFGMTGGAIAGFCDALGESAIRFVHCRHETGAAFAATEAYFASGRPSLVFSTTGPGILNALTGVAAARWEGARLVLVSASTSASLRGRGACQETSAYTMPLSGLYSSGPLFHYAVSMEHPAELSEVIARLASGLSRPGGFVAHVALPTALQNAPASVTPGQVRRSTPPMCPTDAIDDCVEMLRRGRFVIWLGFGAHDAADAVRALVERTGALVMCSPRAKGIFPERHPSFIGVTGAGGYGEPEQLLQNLRPAHVLVLGSRLGETTSYWQPEFIPEHGFIHVDVDPTVPGTAYPDAITYPVHADVRCFVNALLDRWPPARDQSAIRRHALDEPSDAHPIASRVYARARAKSDATPSAEDSPGVRAVELMDAVQRRVVDGSDAVVMTEAGNSFIWGNHLLRFDDPGRYRVSLAFGSMGHCAAGVVGAALARDGKAVAIVGDGSMLMNNEVSTAVQYGAKAVWIVFNDAAYGIVEQGMRAQGFRPTGTTMPRVDFAAVARAMGAGGARVDHVDALDDALDAAMEAEGPFVVDVRIDGREPAPWMKRIKTLIAQGAKGNQDGG